MEKSAPSSIGKWLSGIGLLVCVSSMIGCVNRTQELTLDTSSQEALKESVEALLASLADQPVKHAKLEMAFKMISMSSMGNQKGDITFQDVWGKYNGMTVEELIASKPLGVDIEAMEFDADAVVASRLNRESQNRMREIVLALHNYHDAFRAFPARFNQDKDGKPLLSWRVHILPFINNTLYNQFHLDEPFDSEHNIKLVEQMPDCYSNPKLKLAPGYTAYVGPAGKDTVWVDPGNDRRSPTGMKLRDVSDGISRTAALIEVSADQAVVWTKPVDFDIDQPGFADKLKATAKIINLAAADASVFILDSDLTEKQWRLVFGANDGDEQDPRDFRSDRQ